MSSALMTCLTFVCRYSTGYVHHCDGSHIFIYYVLYISPGKRRRGHSNHIDTMREIFLMAEDREDRRQRVHQEFEERRLQVLQELERSAGIRETELINTLAQFNQGLLSVMGQLVSVMASNHSPQSPP